MIDKTDPETWTKSYVSSNQTLCLQVLREVNALVLNSLSKKDYLSAAVCLDRLLSGLAIMHSANCGNFVSYLSIYSVCAATISAFGLDMPEYKRRDMVLAGLEDALDFSPSKETTKYVTAMIADLKSGMSFPQLQQKYSPKFPQDEISLIKDLGSKL